MTDELRNLARSAPNKESFYRPFLAHVVHAIENQAAAVWDCQDSQHVRLLVSWQNSSAPQVNFGGQNEHAGLALKTLDKNSPVVITPKVEIGDRNSHPVLALVPVKRETGGEVVELFLPPGKSSEEYEKSLEALREICALAHDLSDVAVASPTDMVDQMPRPAADGQVAIGLRQLDEYVREVHRSLDLNEVGFRIANGAQSVLGCDRVSVFQIKNGKSKMIAASGQPSVNRRSNTVRQLEALTDQMLPTREAFWYPQGETEVPPPIATPLNTYLTESTVRSLAVIPIASSDIPESEASGSPVRKVERTIGGIVFEHFSEDLTRPQVREKILIVSQHAADAFRNATSHRQLFLYPLWKTLGKSKIVTSVCHLPKTLSITAGLLLLVAILTFFPANFYVSGEGVLVPQNNRKVFNLIDGQIVDVVVAHGEPVTVGQPLLTLENKNLAIEAERVSGELETVQKQIELIEKAILGSTAIAGSPQDKVSNLRVEAQTLEKRGESLKRQKDIINDQTRDLVVSSPIDGSIITWNVDENLLNRPVARGTSLLEVADLDGSWIIEVDLPDKRIGHLLSAQSQLKEDLEVEFILASNPSASFAGNVLDVSRVTEVDQEKGQTVRVTVQFDTSAVNLKQVRTEVQAKIYCGRRSLGYVWLHDIFEFVQSKILFRLW